MRVNLLVRYLDPYDGYGNHALHLRRTLKVQGIKVKTVMHSRRKQIDDNDLTISLLYGDYISAIRGRQWAFTMWEDTAVPRHWVASINAHCERLLVPCQHNKGLFEQAGVRVPVHVVNEGIDPTVYLNIERPKRDIYTFLVIGDRDNRKGWDTALFAFTRAFSGVDDVRIVIKARKFPLQWTDKRIQVMCQDVESMNEVYEMADCFVFPSKGEGWGLPPREAAATGLPVIATRYSGLVEGIDHWAIPINNFYMAQSRMPSENGMWAIPSYEELEGHMRWCYENRDAAATIGRKASQWLHENQTWEHGTAQLVELLTEYGNG